MQLLPAPGPASSAHPVPHVDESHPASGGRAKKIFSQYTDMHILRTKKQQKENRKKTERIQFKRALRMANKQKKNRMRQGSGRNRGNRMIHDNTLK